MDVSQQQDSYSLMWQYVAVYCMSTSQEKYNFYEWCHGDRSSKIKPGLQII